MTVKKDKAYKQVETAYESMPEPEVTFTFDNKYIPERDSANFYYKYDEGQIISDFKDYIDATYSQHYKTDEDSVECFDAWIALGDSTPTFRNTALKYLWRYGKKNGNNKADLMKALHYVMMCLYVDHYKGKQ
jgi:hypothetical protein